jgi:hypothetical protein
LPKGDDAMRAVRMYTGDDQRTYFEEIDLPEGEQIPVKHMVFGTLDGFDQPLHTAPRRQLVVVLEGAIELGSPTGTVTIGPGEALLAEDTTGEGHSHTIAHARLLTLPLEDSPALGR